MGVNAGINYETGTNDNVLIGYGAGKELELVQVPLEILQLE